MRFFSISHIERISSASMSYRLLLRIVRDEQYTRYTCIHTYTRMSHIWSMIYEVSPQRPQCGNHICVCPWEIGLIRRLLLFWFDNATRWSVVLFNSVILTNIIDRKLSKSCVYNLMSLVICELQFSVFSVATVTSALDFYRQGQGNNYTVYYKLVVVILSIPSTFVNKE